MNLSRRYGVHVAKVAGLALALQGLCMAPSAAQALRDPTQPPVQMRPPAPAASGATASSSSNSNSDGSEATLPGVSDGLTVVTRDGKPHLVVGTRLYGVGQKIEGYVIERISETEVWMRGPAGLKKLPRFADIQRVTVTPVNEECLASPAAAASRPVAQKAKNSSKPRVKPVVSPGTSVTPSVTPSVPASASAAADTTPASGTVVCPGVKP